MTRKTHSAGSTVAWIVGVLFVVYLLSPGPVVGGLYGSGLAPYPYSNGLEQFLEAFYFPIAYVADHVPGVSEFYIWYFELWGVPW